MASPVTKSPSKPIYSKSNDAEDDRQLLDNEKEENLFFSNFHHTIQAFEVLNTMRSDNLFCDVILQADDGPSIRAHKMILAACSTYFYVMFTKFKERDEECIRLEGMSHFTLELLVNYIYTTKIEITEENVQSLLSAADLFQFNDIRDACCDFLKLKVDPANCLGIRAFADVHGLIDLLKYVDHYIEQYFLEVLQGDEFLSLAPKQVVKLISNDQLSISCEEKIFEGVLSWVRADLKNRKNVLSQLMNHIRLPLLSEEYIHQRVMKEPLLESILQCKDFLSEALNYHLLRKKETTLKNPKTKRRSRPKVLLMIGGDAVGPRTVKYYDLTDEKWYRLSDLPAGRCYAELSVLGERIYAVGGCFGFDSLSLTEVYDSTIDEWSSCQNMLESRSYHSIGVLDNWMYAIGGENGELVLNSAEKFNAKNNEWQMIATMTTPRTNLGIGVIGNYLYAVGGQNYELPKALSSVERYDPEENKWSFVAKMSVARSRAAVGVLNGILYAIGGWNGHSISRTAEAYDPKINQWKSIANMIFPSSGARVVAFNEMLYVVGNDIEVQVYSPKTNSWTTILGSMSKSWNYSNIILVDKPRAKAIPF